MLRPIASLIATATACLGLFGQAFYQSSARVTEEPDSLPAMAQTMRGWLDQPLDSLDNIAEPYDTVVVMKPLPGIVFLPVVYTHFRDYTDYKPFEPEYSGNEAFRWIDEANALHRKVGMMRQNVAMNAPQAVPYNVATLPEAPKEYYGVADPSKHTIEVHEVEPTMPDHMTVKVQKKHWLRKFDASLQFSQAYVSPNWYQGGNNNLNFLANILYDVKLNPAYHPNLLFETTMQYKLGLNSAPDDSLRNYSISEDLLQINTTFGFKAAHRWYYSLTAQFKTQLLNSYVKNTNNLNSAFLSPGELTAGIGMTYNYANAKKTFTFDASIAPLSYNMKICTRDNAELSHETFGIKPDRKTVSKFGSTAECKITWQIAANIHFKSRLFVFTDYGYIQGDWENTLAMDINRYLTTQIYCHARYDSTTPRCDDPSWHKLQVKEILSFGVQYRFSSL